MKERIEKTLAKINKCSGNCKDCKNLVYHSTSTERAIYYAFGCKYTEWIFGAISESTKTMKAEIIEALNFELQ